MEYQFSQKMNQFQSSIFTLLDEKKQAYAKTGSQVYNLSIGTPDFLPEPHIVQALSEAAQKPENYKYAVYDLPELVEAVKSWYRQRYDVSLEKEEILSVYGSQEGLAHICLPLCDPGDIVLVPNPGYPIFSIGPFLSGAKLVPYPLLAENHFLPDFDAIPIETAKKAKAIVISYPANPTCVTAPDSVYENLIAFAKKYHIAVLHDNAYSEIVYDGKKGKSFLSFPGAKEVGIEFNSLSKTYHMTGCRISFAVGNKEIISKFRTLRSQIDYGIFLPVQYGAIAALTGPQDGVKKMRETYEKRRNALCGGLRKIGWQVPDCEGTMFVWAPLPDGYQSSEAFCLTLLEKTGVVCVPGISFGTLGEGYIRLALVLPENTLEEMVSVIQKSGILKK